MLVYVKRLHYLGALEALPVNANYARQIRAHLREFVPKESAKATLFFQSEEEGVEALGLTRKHLRDLHYGLTITIRIDDWEFLHCYGYDTHLLVESGLLYKRIRVKKLTRRKSDEEKQP